MKFRTINRIAGILLISAVSLVGTSAPVNARQEPQGKPDVKQNQGGKKRLAKKKQQAPVAEEKLQQNPTATDQKLHARNPKAAQVKPKRHEPIAAPVPIAAEPIAKPVPIAEPVPIARKPKVQRPKAIQQPVVATPRLPAERQQVLIAEQRVRSTAYYHNLQDQQRIAEQRAIILRQQNRLAQYRYQQQYYEQLRQQQSYLERNQMTYAYNSDPFYYTAPSYRYARDGNYYETNRYGMDMLRQAANYGYQQGIEAGRADRSDRWGNGYEDSFAYQDANYGYRGYYVDQNEYNYYFRQGFSRGYEDGYNSRYSYGSRSNGTLSILGAVLVGFLNFESLN